MLQGNQKVKQRKTIQINFIPPKMKHKTDIERRRKKILMRQKDLKDLIMQIYLGQYLSAVAAIEDYLKMESPRSHQISWRKLTGRKQTFMNTA